MGAYGGFEGAYGWPNFNAWIQNTWGSGQEFDVICGSFFGATNLVFGTNPPYYLDDFQSIYPKFFGPSTQLSGCGSTVGTNVLTVPTTNGLTYGQFVQAYGVLPPGSVIVGLGNNTITVNNNAIATAANTTLLVYQSAPIPAGIVLLYLDLANASLVQARWQEQWYVAMAFFIAHYCTLYAKSDASEVFETLQTVTHTEAPSGATPGTIYTLSGPPPGGALQALVKNGSFLVPGTAYTLSGATIMLAAATVAGDVLSASWPIQIQALVASNPNGAQIAAAGLAGGIQTSKGVGDVSVSYSALTALDSWAAWGLTTYGQQLATMARIVGSGPMVIY